MYLQEGITDTVYHYTQLSVLLKIIKKDTFLLQPCFFDDQERYDNKRFYFMSTTRNKAATEGFAFKKQDGYNSVARICLDGRRLSQRYKGKPMEYYDEDDRGEEMEDGWSPTAQRHTMKEAEDRIFSTEPFIRNAHNYILRIDVLCENDETNDLSIIKALSPYTQNFNIHYYRDRNSYMLENNNEVNVNTIINGSESDYEESDDPHALTDKEIAYIMKFLFAPYNIETNKITSLLNSYNLSFYANDNVISLVNELSNGIQKCKSYGEFDFYFRTIKVMAAHALNEKCGKYPTEEKSRMAKLATDFMVKNGYRSINDAYRNKLDQFQEKEVRESIKQKRFIKKIVENVIRRIYNV